MSNAKNNNLSEKKIYNNKKRSRWKKEILSVCHKQLQTTAAVIRNNRTHTITRRRQKFPPSFPHSLWKVREKKIANQKYIETYENVYKKKVYASSLAAKIGKKLGNCKKRERNFIFIRKRKQKKKNSKIIFEKKKLFLGSF